MKVDIVIGSMFGDEGKGLMVDHLAQPNTSIVIRHNGGANAGHTVHVDQHGPRHVFHHFGSGSCKPNVHTYLSEFFIVDPLMYFVEFNQLNNKLDSYGQVSVRSDNVFINTNCKVSTIFDYWINVSIERLRGKNKHGSCGFGINETVHRNEYDSKFRLTVSDLQSKDTIKNKLIIIKNEYVPLRLEQLGIPSDYLQDVPEISEELIVLMNGVYERSTIVFDDTFLLGYEHLIFEGAQGLSLDEEYKFFPHVTRSKTGILNASSILNKIRVNEATVHYMTRSYTTRHGQGPLPFEYKYGELDYIEDLTNIPNPHQDTLRFSPLNFSMLVGNIQADLLNSNGVIIQPHVVVTCMNQLKRNDFKVCEDNTIHYIENDVDFIEWFGDNIQERIPNLLTPSFSYGPYRTSVWK